MCSDEMLLCIKAQKKRTNYNISINFSYNVVSKVMQVNFALLFFFKSSGIKNMVGILIQKHFLLLSPL